MATRKAKKIPPRTDVRVPVSATQLTCLGEIQARLTLIERTLITARKELAVYVQSILDGEAVTLPETHTSFAMDGDSTELVFAPPAPPKEIQ
jgi:hypothetical protein